MALSRSELNVESFPGLAIPKTRDGQSVSMDRIEEKRAIERAWEAVKAIVAKRDKFRCRMCGLACHYGHPDISKRADPHHIIFASAGGPDESWNLLYMCRSCHDLVHIVKRFFLSGNADDRDPAGKGCVKVERQVESGFAVVGFI